MTVYADDRVVWDGSVGRETAGLNGPVGFRTDNAAVDLELFAERRNANVASDAAPARCERGPED